MLCFSYGSNMSSCRLRHRVSSARFYSVATLAGHRLLFHKAGKDGSGKCATQHTGNPLDIVYGVLWHIAEHEKAVLDRIEGLGRGYERGQVAVQCGTDSLVSFLYAATHIDSTLKPYHWYKEHVLVGARENRLPPEYVRTIEAVEAIEDPMPARSEHELSIYRGQAE